MKKICVFILVLAALLSGGYMIANAQTGDNAVSAVYYMQEPIRSGDTLWSIAARNRPKGITTQAFIQEIMAINQLEDDVIIAGNCLVVPVYR